MLSDCICEKQVAAVARGDDAVKRELENVEHHHPDQAVDPDRDDRRRRDRANADAQHADGDGNDLRRQRSVPPALIPLENKRNFLEVSGDIVERVDPVFFSDPMTAAMKSLGIT
jgi:hypothetical protein